MVNITINPYRQASDEIIFKNSSYDKGLERLRQRKKQLIAFAVSCFLLF